MALLPGTIHASAASWRNWSGSQQASPGHLLYASNEQQIIDAIRQARQVRAVGGSHSFSGLVPTEGTMISLEALNGLISHDADTLQATFRAGSRLAQVSSELARIGQALYNEPDVNVQSLGGAISTATHGTGLGLPCLSAYVSAITLINGRGERVECSAARHPELFQAARVGVGSLGVMTQISLQNLPAYKLRETLRVTSIEEALLELEEQGQAYRHLEFLGFIEGDRALLKYHQFSDAGDTPVPTRQFDENQLLEFAADTARRMPWLNSWLQQLVGLFIDEGSRVGPSWKIFPSPRSVQFNEMEYQLPLERGFACFRELVQAQRASGLQVFFPLEVRLVKADDLWLSPFQGRDSLSISVHQYAKQAHQPLFQLAEPILRKHGGRPHWGKLHSLTATELAPLYPNWQDFLAVRREQDPEGKFLNPYMQKLLGVNA